MAYALAGIPLMLLYMASVGDILASAFRYAYFNFLCRGAGRKRKPTRRSASRSRRARSQADSVDSDSDFLPGGGAAAYDAGLDAVEAASVAARRRGGSGRSKGEKQIPVWACLSVIAGFVAGGATLFSAWEGWPLLDAAYFCVVSLVTVGFGDLVPGDSFRGAETTAEVATTTTKAPPLESTAAAAVGIKEALTTVSPADVTTVVPSSTARRLLDASDYIDMYEEYVDLVTTSVPSTAVPEEDLTPAFGGVFSDYVTTKDMMMVDGKLTFCALYLLTGMALLAMNFHLMQETGLRAARRMLDRLRPSWGQSKKGGARERSVLPSAGGACHLHNPPHGWGTRGEAWRRRTWAGEGGRRYASRGQGEFYRGRRGSWAEGGTDKWESEEDGLDEQRPPAAARGGSTGTGGVVITLQAEDGAVYDWEPGGGYSSYTVSAEEDIGIVECRGGRIAVDHEEAGQEADEEEVNLHKPSPSSIRSSGGRRSRTPRMGEAPEGVTVAASASSRGLNRLEVPSKTNPEDQSTVAFRRLQQADPRRFQRSRSLGPEAPPPSPEWRRSPSRRSLGAGAGMEVGVREGGERGARAITKGKRGPISAWRKRRKRKKGPRRVGVAAIRHSGFRNPFFSTSSLERIPPHSR